jgi:diaminopimelate epimerase
VVFEFNKMSGAGNDFVLIDARKGNVKLTSQQVVRICDRHQGVGADGLMLWVPSKSRKTEWAWQFFNNDGSEGEMCGNGARCFARFVQKHTQANGSLSFETGAGIITAEFVGEQVTVNLTAPQNLRLNEKIALSSGQEIVHSINTGVPHAVLFVKDADLAMVQQQGKEVRNHQLFAPRGTNVNFAQLAGPNRIRVRTYERGVEGETLACGTGVTASALIAARLHGLVSPVRVQVQSGEELAVAFATHGDGFDQVKLSGSAKFIFEGRMEL